jgi:hypothetical protein
MTFSNLIAEAEQYKLTNEISGQWATIQLKLNSFSAEFLNVGVVFCSENNGIRTKFLDDYTGLLALMPNQFNSTQFKFLTDLTDESLKKAQSLNNIKLPSPTLQLSNTSFFSGDSCESITDWLFDQCITLAQCKKIRTKNIFRTRNDDEIQKDIFSSIKAHDKLRANQYLQESIYQTEDDNGIVHAMRVPLMTDTKVATIANGWVKTWEVVKSNILDAQTDLSAVSKLSKRQGTLFLQRSDDMKGISSAELTSLDENIDELIWKINKSGSLVLPDFGIDNLSHKIIEWADAA